MSVERLARSVPDTPSRTVVHEDEIHVLAIHMSKPNHRKQRGPSDPDQAIAEFAVNTARLAGFIPSKRQPMPGTHKLWEAPDPVTLHRKLPGHARLCQHRVNSVPLQGPGRP